MKQFNVIKQLFFLALLSASFTASAQIQPLAFSVGTNVNWYLNYVGLRLEVTNPVSIAGDKQYTTAYSGTTPWGGRVTTPLVNVPVIMDTTADSFGCTPFTIDMTGKIAVVWRGPIASPCEFGTKALDAQNAHAKAVVLINEYPGAGPIGMAAGASGGTVTIPVFMISNQDGQAISGRYRAGQPVTMTITPWGLGLRNDIGFVRGGAAGWHAFSVPYDQLTPGATPAAYKGLDGAFIANFGSSDAKNVKVAGSLYYTPRSTGVKALLHTDTASGESLFRGLAHLPHSDSIVAMFTTPEYNFAPPSVGPGKYDLTYTLSSDTANQNPLDTSTTISFYASDSVYSKGTYDFVNRVPVSTTWEAATGSTDFVWGNMYYVAHGGDAVRTLQFSLYNSNNTLGDITAPPVDLLVFKWIDGSNGHPKDSFVQNGELHLVSQGTYSFVHGDTSGMEFTVPFMTDSGGHRGVGPMWLDSNSWYYAAAVVPNGYFLGCDGSAASVYPRVYGRAHSNGYLENMDLIWTGDYVSSEGPGPYIIDSVNSGYLPVAFAGSLFIDSFNFAGQKGLIPSIPIIVTKTPDTSHAHDAVAGILKPAADIKLFPNPANEFMDVSISMEKPAHTVTYTVIDGLARFVSKDTHYNVKQEDFKMSTRNLPAGNYYLLVNIDDVLITKKFTIVK